LKGKKRLPGIRKERNPRINNINGIYFDNDIVATDGHRLSLTRDTNPLRNALVPSEFVTPS